MVKDIYAKKMAAEAKPYVSVEHAANMDRATLVRTVNAIYREVSKSPKMSWLRENVEGFDVFYTKFDERSLIALDFRTNHSASYNGHEVQFLISRDDVYGEGFADSLKYPTNPPKPTGNRPNLYTVTKRVDPFFEGKERGNETQMTLRYVPESDSFVEETVHRTQQKLREAESSPMDVDENLPLAQWYPQVKARQFVANYPELFNTWANWW